VQDYIIPVPLGAHILTLADEELIDAVSHYEARREYCKWTINEATTAYYNVVLREWKRRHKNKHLPRKALTYKDMKQYTEDFYEECSTKI